MVASASGAIVGENGHGARAGLAPAAETGYRFMRIQPRFGQEGTRL